MDHLLLIAINEYLHWNPLHGPMHDAEALREVLVSEYGFLNEYVTTCYNDQASAKGIHQVLRELKSRLAMDDRVLIFFAGHGYADLEFTQTGFWIPWDAEKDVSERVRWIPNGDIRGILSNLPARHVLLISDSCFSGELLEGTRDLSERKKDWADIADCEPSRVVLTSGGLEKVSDADFRGGSLFAWHLVDSLRRCRDPWVDAQELHARIRRGVKGQTPRYGVIKGAGDRGGAFLLRPRDTSSSLSQQTEEIADISKTANMAVMEVDSIPPGMEVLIDGGQWKGITPFEVQGILWGTHHARARHGEAIFRQEFLIENFEHSLLLTSVSDQVHPAPFPKQETLPAPLPEQEEDKTMSNPHFSQDIRTLDSGGYGLSDILNNHTVLIVTGTYLPSELLDRPIAEHLRDELEKRCEGIPGFRVLVMSDYWYGREDRCRRLATITLGGPGINALVPEDQRVEWDPVVNVAPRRVDLWGKSAQGTRDAVRQFREQCLDRWLQTHVSLSAGKAFQIGIAHPSLGDKVLKCGKSQGERVSMVSNGSDERCLWILEPLQGDDTGFFHFKNVETGLCLDVLDWAMESGAPVGAWSYQGNFNQHWSVIQYADSTYRIENRHSGKALDFYRDGQEKHVIQWDWHGEPNQRWHLIPEQPLLPMAGAFERGLIRCIDPADPDTFYCNPAKDESQESVRFFRDGQHNGVCLHWKPVHTPSAPLDIQLPHSRALLESKWIAVMIRKGLPLYFRLKLSDGSSRWLAYSCSVKYFGCNASQSEGVVPVRKCVSHEWRTLLLNITQDAKYFWKDLDILSVSSIRLRGEAELLGIWALNNREALDAGSFCNVEEVSIKTRG